MGQHEDPQDETLKETISRITTKIPGTPRASLKERKEGA